MRTGRDPTAAPPGLSRDYRSSRLRRMEFRLPERSGDYEYSTIQSWLKRVGDRVEAGEPLVEVETDKATEEVEAPVSGTLADILAEEGDEVKVDMVLAIIEEAR